MTGRGRLAAAGIGLGLFAIAGAAASAAVAPAAHDARTRPTATAPRPRATRPGYPMAWQPTVVASRFVDYSIGPHPLRYGTPVATTTLTRYGERVRSEACAYASCWAIGVTSQGYQYPLTRPSASRTWRIGGPWFSGAWARTAASVASRIQILTPRAVIAFTRRDWAYLSTDRGQDWHLVGLGHVVNAAVVRDAVGHTTYRVTAQTTSTPVQTRDYTSTNGVVWRLAAGHAR